MDSVKETALKKYKELDLYTKLLLDAYIWDVKGTFIDYVGSPVHSWEECREHESPLSILECMDVQEEHNFWDEYSKDEDESNDDDDNDENDEDDDDDGVTEPWEPTYASDEYVRDFKDLIKQRLEGFSWRVGKVLGCRGFSKEESKYVIIYLMEREGINPEYLELDKYDTEERKWHGKWF